jgi:transposase-like protein
MFPDEASAVAYIFKLRWSDGNPCSSGCKGSYALYSGGRVIHCKACRKSISLTASTIMHKSHTPLLTWLYGAYLITTLTPGISAVQFAAQLGLNEEAAFQMLHKLRAAMVAPDREPLHGPVEVDETYVGGAGGGEGRSTETKTLVVGAVEVVDKKDGTKGAKRLRLRVLEDASGAELIPFVRDHVEPGAIVLTDGWRGYRGLTKAGYVHEPEIESELPVIHREFANLKTWLQGTHHGRVERQHLQAYLNEFAFRHNRRFWKFSAFQRLMEIAVGTTAPTYDELYNADEYGRNVHLGFGGIADLGRRR